MQRKIMFAAGTELVCWSFAASKRQLGQDGVWVQDTENCKTSYCGYGTCGHWRPRSRVRHRYRACVLLVELSAGMGRGESWDYWTDSWHDQPHCTYEYWGLFWHCGKIFIVPFHPLLDMKDLSVRTNVWNLLKTIGNNQNHSCFLVYVWHQAWRISRLTTVKFGPNYYFFLILRNIISKDLWILKL